MRFATVPVHASSPPRFSIRLENGPYPADLGSDPGSDPDGSADPNGSASQASFARGDEGTHAQRDVDHEQRAHRQLRQHGRPLETAVHRGGEATEQRRDYLLAAHRHLVRQRNAGGGGDRR